MRGIWRRTSGYFIFMGFFHPHFIHPKLWIGAFCFVCNVKMSLSLLLWENNSFEISRFEPNFGRPKFLSVGLRGKYFVLRASQFPTAYRGIMLATKTIQAYFAHTCCQLACFANLCKTGQFRPNKHGREYSARRRSRLEKSTRHWCRLENSACWCQS